jgi:hypothetical protein
MVAVRRGIGKSISALPPPSKLSFQIRSQLNDWHGRSRVWPQLPAPFFFLAISGERDEETLFQSVPTLSKLAMALNAQYLGVVEAGGNVPSLSLILEVCEVLGADAGAMVREVAEARRMPKA